MRKYKILFLIAIFLFISKVCAFELHVENFKGDKINIEVESSDTIEKLKEKIQDNEGTPIENQKLIFNNKQLEEGRTLADYSIQKGSIIYLELLNALEFEVVFDANGGIFKNNKDILIIPKWKNEYENQIEIPTKEGYTFKGYYTEKVDGTKFELILAESGIDSDITFYAQWEENPLNSPVIPGEENPNTSDNIKQTIIICIVSLFSLIGLIKYKERT